MGAQGRLQGQKKEGQFWPWGWPWGWAVALIGINLGLRFWQLGRLNTLVFDEVYYVRFAVDYLHQRPFFDVHPPLGKYLIAASIGLFNASPWGTSPPQNAFAGVLLNPVSYRWLNAGLGAGIPLIVGWGAWELGHGLAASRRQRWGILAAVLTTCDGFTLLESRLGLLHTGLLWFGLVGTAAWLRSRHCSHPLPWRLLAGLAFGACISIKWNGAGYLLPLWLLAAGQGDPGSPAHPPLNPSPSSIADTATALIEESDTSEPSEHRRDRRRLWRAPMPWLWLGGVPVLVYWALWQPHLALTGTGFWQIHWDILQAHRGLTAVHPYQSPWYTWPLLVRPIAYFYQGLALGEGPGAWGPPLPHPAIAIALYGLTNPLLGWLSTATIALFGLQALANHRRSLATVTATLPRWIGIAYCAHWLPWALVQRSTFFYHYLPASLTAELGLAWLMSGWFTARRSPQGFCGMLLLSLVILSFIFWLPLWVGGAISPEALQWHWWLPTWI